MKQEEKTNGASDWDLPDNPRSDESISSKANKTRTNPFGIEHVDPLVFHQSDDNPELRAAAMKVTQFPSLRISEPAPVKPTKRKYIEWIPGFKSMTTVDGQGISIVKKTYSRLRFLFGVLIVVIPIALIVLIVNFGLNLYKG